MPLTAEQEKQLAELQAERSRPEPRTETGVAGVLHMVLDVLSGAVPHLASDAWAALHSSVETELGTLEQKPAADEGQAADAAPGKTSSGSKAKS